MFCNRQALSVAYLLLLPLAWMAPTAREITSSYKTRTVKPMLPRPMILKHKSLIAKSSSNRGRVDGIDSIEHRLRDVVPVNLHQPCDMSPLIADSDADYFEPDYIDAIERLEADLGRKAEQATEHVDLDEWLVNSAKNGGITKDGGIANKATQRQRAGYIHLHTLITKTQQLQTLVSEMVRKSMIEECHNLPYKPVIHFPSNITKNSELLPAMEQIYRTLTNQTSHLYFIWARQNNQTRLRSSIICEDHLTSWNMVKGARSRKMKKQHALQLSNHFMLVGDSLRELMCNFHRTFFLFGMPIPAAAIVDEVLDHRIRSSTVCVRQSLLDCLIMRNAIAIFAQIEHFLRDNSVRFVGLQ